MSSIDTATKNQINTLTMTRPHPLNFLSAEELSQASAILKRILADQNIQNFRFKNVSLKEPPKALLFPYLEAEATGMPVSQRPFVPRLVEIGWSIDNERKLNESIVSLDSNSEVRRISAKHGQHSSFDRDEIRSASQKLLKHPLVLEAVKLLNLPENSIIQCDCWPYGADRDSTVETHKYIQALLYARGPESHGDSNQYAFPLPFSALFDVFLEDVVEIVPLATGGTEDGLNYHTATENPMEHCRPNEYHPELVEDTRKDLKALHITQPDGPSFNVTDINHVSWQKWKFRVGFNYREGMTIHDVRYDGRSVFYRLSISEMTVPYGDPRSPFHRKQAFDLGDAGAGIMANNLSLGCDCLGVIKYFNGWLSNEKGEPVEAKNVICMHEQDFGIGWKHTNHRTQGVGITRARILVLQSIITVGNYEYIFAWHFWQNGNVELETRSTGILSTQLIDPGKTSEWGNVVSPGVMAANHQHLFCLRVDPMLDGINNTVIWEDSIPIPKNEEENPHGNAWRIVKTPFSISGFADANPFANRCFKIVNEDVRNRISGNPVGYKLIPQPCQLLIASKDSVVRKRARFAEHHIWVTQYRDGELWAGGKWTNQSLVEKDGVFDYASRNDDVQKRDLVLWHTFGMTHNPRVEDFPVMPVEISTISFKPADFFERNPAIDVPQSTQAQNKSVLVDESSIANREANLVWSEGSTKVESSKL